MVDAVVYSSVVQLSVDNYNGTYSYNQEPVLRNVPRQSLPHCCLAVFLP